MLLHLEETLQIDFFSLSLSLLILFIFSPFWSNRMNLQRSTPSSFLHGVSSPGSEFKPDVKFDFNDGNHIYDDPDTLLPGRYSCEADTLNFPDNNFDVKVKTFGKPNANDSCSSMATASAQSPVYNDCIGKYSLGPCRDPSSNFEGSRMLETSTDQLKPASSTHLSSHFDVPKSEKEKECSEGKMGSYMHLLRKRVEIMENSYEPSAQPKEKVLSAESPLDSDHSIPPVPVVEEDQYVDVTISTDK